MKMILMPLFGGSGVGIDDIKHYVTPNTQLCIWDRAFPYQPNAQYVRFPTSERPLMIGNLTPEIYEGKVFIRKMALDMHHYDEYELTHDGFGNKPVWLYAKALKEIPFSDYSRLGGQLHFEEKFSIQYLQSLPDDIKVLLLFYL